MLGLMIGIMVLLAIYYTWGFEAVLTVLLIVIIYCLLDIEKAIIESSEKEE